MRGNIMPKKKTKVKKTISAEDIERFRVLMTHINYAVEDCLGNPDKAVE